MAEGEVYYAEDGTASVVLEEQYDPNYEPTQKEMDDYADFIGIDAKKEPELMWIAREALKAPLPSEWKPCKTDTGEVYYFNFKTGDSIWEHPLDEHYKTKVAEERANLAVGGVSKEKKVKKEKKEKAEKKTTKIEKGGAGNASLEFKETKKKAPVAELVPKTGRLGALGSDPSVETGRKKPDVSDLLGTKKEDPSPLSSPRLAAGAAPKLGLAGLSATTSLTGAPTLGNPNDPLKIAASLEAEERKIKQEMEADTEQQVKALEAKLEKEAERMKAEAEENKKRVEMDLKAKNDLEIQQQKRTLSARYSRELTTLRNNLDDEFATLRRDIKELEDKFEAEKSACQRRKQSALDELKMDMDRYVAKESGKQRGDLQDNWMAEKAKLELKTSETLRDLETEHAATLERIKSSNEHLYQDEITALEQQLNAEYAQLEMDVAAKKRERQLAMNAKLEEEGKARSAEIQKIEEQHHNAMQEARSKHAAAMQTLNEQVDQTLAQLRREHEAAKFEVIQQRDKQAAEAAQRQEEDAVRRRKLEEEEYKSEEAKLEAETKAALEAYDRETDRLSHEARQATLEKENSAAARKTAEEEQRIHQEHEAEIAEMDRKFALDKDTLVSRIRQEYKEKRELARKKRLAEAEAAGNAKMAADMAEYERARQQHEEKLATMLKEKEMEQERKYDQHAEKAKKECEERIRKYRDEVQNRKAPDSPLRRARAVEAEQQKVQQKIADRKRELDEGFAQLQKQYEEILDKKAFALAQKLISEHEEAAERERKRRELENAKQWKEAQQAKKSDPPLPAAQKPPLSEPPATGNQEPPAPLPAVREEDSLMQTQAAVAASSRPTSVPLQRQETPDTVEPTSTTLRSQTTGAFSSGPTPDLVADAMRPGTGNSEALYPSSQPNSRPNSQLGFQHDSVSRDHQRSSTSHNRLGNLQPLSYDSTDRENGAVGLPPRSNTAVYDSPMRHPQQQLPRSNSAIHTTSAAPYQQQQQQYEGYASRQGAAHHYQYHDQVPMMGPNREMMASNSGSPPRGVQIYGDRGSYHPQHHQQDRFEEDQREAERLRKTLVSVREKDRKFQERVQRAKEIINKKKQEIRAKQSEIMLAREDWHKDMATAKASGDANQQKILHSVKRRLEAQAKEYNEEAHEVRRAQEWLKHQQKLQEEKMNRKLDQSLTPIKDEGGGRGSKPHSRIASPKRSSREASAATSGASRDELVALVHTMADRMAKVEDALLRATYPRPNRTTEVAGQRSKNGGSNLFKDPTAENPVGPSTKGKNPSSALPPSPNRGTSGEEMRNKWGKWLEKGKPTSSSTAQKDSSSTRVPPMQQEGGPLNPNRMSEVEQWVADTLQSPRR